MAGILQLNSINIMGWITLFQSGERGCPTHGRSFRRILDLYLLDTSIIPFPDVTVSKSSGLPNVLWRQKLTQLRARISKAFGYDIENEEIQLHAFIPSLYLVNIFCFAVTF